MVVEIEGGGDFGIGARVVVGFSLFVGGRTLLLSELGGLGACSGGHVWLCEPSRDGDADAE